MAEDARLALAHRALRAETPEVFAEAVRAAFAGHPLLDRVEALAAAVFGRAEALPPGLDAAAEDAPFVALMARVVARRGGKAAWPSVLELGPELDFLEAQLRATDLSLVQFCCLALQRRRAASRQVAVVVMARDEGIYLPEWLAHARLIGAERIFVYANDNADGSDALLEAMAAEGLIVLVRHRLGARVNPQRKAYQHALLLLDELREYRWAAFIDVDEFPYFGDVAPGAMGRLLDDVERQGGAEVPAGVFLPWRWRVTDRQYHRHGLGVMPDYPYGYDRVEGKSIVRLAAVETMGTVHWPLGVPPSRMVDGMGREMAVDRMAEGVERPYEGPTMEHYWSKSFVEYVVKKRRGDALDLDHAMFRREWWQFFEWTSPWVQPLHHPIAPGWLARVAAETAAILARPAVGAAYAEVVRRYRAMTEAALQDGELFRTYMEGMSSRVPQFR